MYNAQEFFSLNIGLTRNDGKAPNSPEKVLRELTLAGVRVHAIQVAQSSTEPTFLCIAQVRDGGYFASETADSLCVRLAQDCIAAVPLRFEEQSQHGLLLGPNAAKWGRFNSSFFLSCLSEHEQVARFGDLPAPEAA